MTPVPPRPTSQARRRLLAVAIAAAGPLALGCSATPAAAQSPLVEVQLVDRDSGAVLPTWRHRGQLYAAGRPGARYAIRVSNRSGGRVLAVVSVDGVNVLSGETAAWHQGGYVLDPWVRLELTGWRKSMDEVAAFEFAALGDSYAARTGRAAHVGVVGVATFRERVPEPTVSVAPSSRFPGSSGAAADEAGRASGAPASPETATAGAPAPSSRSGAVPAGALNKHAATSAERLGTAHGALEGSRAVRTSFERASSAPEGVHAIRYDSRANLVAAGIIPVPRPARPAPSPFPDSPLAGFVPDPPR
jgi:hypothetical protein